MKARIAAILYSLSPECVATLTSDGVGSRKTTAAMGEGRMTHQRLLPAIVAAVLSGISAVSANTQGTTPPFQIVETTIDDIHAAYRSGRLTARQLVQGYLDRIKAYD